MNNDLSPLITYITQQRDNGTRDEDTRSILIAHNWHPDTVNRAFAVMDHAYGSPQPAYAPPQPTAPQQPIGQTRPKLPVFKAIMWFVSPFIFLIGSAIIAFIAQFSGIDSRAANLFTGLMGVIGVLLFIVGPAIGIFLLVKKR